MPSSTALPIPEKVLSAQQSAEMARIWVADNEQVVTLNPNLWSDPGAWGLMLVDLAKHVANAYAAQGFDANEALNRIRMAMDAEWEHPTDS